MVNRSQWSLWVSVSAFLFVFSLCMALDHFLTYLEPSSQVCILAFLTKNYLLPSLPGLDSLFDTTDLLLIVNLME